MDNSFFILSKPQTAVSSFQMCTWDLGNDDNGFVEMGMEMAGNGGDTIELLLWLPFLSAGCSVSDLYGVISRDDKTSRFVFDDRVIGSEPVDGDRSMGVNITFEQYGRVTLLPVSHIETDTARR
ncbi:MAG: hypothetical protein K2N86_01235, partial [Rikenellaceae bacterium]|nr:hypothetical protein [Rikenellaceae bacterium]